MNQGRPFVIITSQRTGSTLLVRSLDSSPDIFCAGEIFYRGLGIHHPEVQYQYRYMGSRILGRAVDSLWIRRRLEKHLAKFYADACDKSSAAGFKVMVSQLRKLPAILPFVLRERVTCFYLYRRDVFATALSYYKAQRSGIYHGDRQRDHGEGSSIEVNAVDFRKIFDACRADRDEILRLYETLGGRLLEYEDLVDRWDEVIAAIGDALGLPALNVAKVLPRVDSSVGHVPVANEQALRKACGAEATP